MNERPSEPQQPSALFANPNELRADLKLLDERLTQAQRVPISPEFRTKMAKLLEAGAGIVTQFMLAHSDQADKITRMLDRLSSSFEKFDRLNIAQEIQILGAANAQPTAVGPTVNVTQQTAVMVQQPADPAAVAREIRRNDPDYLEYLRQREGNRHGDAGNLGQPLQPGPLESLSPPLAGGPPPDGPDRGTEPAAADDSGAAGAWQDPAS